MNDILTDELLQRSSLTNAQVESMLLQIRSLHGDILQSQARKLRTPREVSKGAYYRVLSQGRRKLIRAIYSILVGVRVGAVGQGEVTRLIETISEVPDNVAPEEAEKILGVVNALVWRIVML
jgi:hypothetical protein